MIWSYNQVRRPQNWRTTIAMITDVQRRRKLGKLAESKEAESYFVLLICSHSAQPQLSAILIRCPPAWWGWKLDITFWQIDLNNWGQEISWSWRRFFILSLFGLFVLLFEQRHLSLSAFVALPPALTGSRRAMTTKALVMTTPARWVVLYRFFSIVLCIMSRNL